MALTTRTVRVELHRGGWEIELPDQREPVTCETLEDARRMAYLCAARRHPCELVVHDAYHRVLHHELIAREGDRGAHAPPAGGGPQDVGGGS